MFFCDNTVLSLENMTDADQFLHDRYQDISRAKLGSRKKNQKKIMTNIFA